MKLLILTTALIVSIAVAFFMFREPLLISIGDYLVVEDQLHPANMIHVIAGPDFRTEYAIQLYKQGLGSKLFFTGGWCDTHQDYHGERGRRLSLAAGVPGTDIVYNDTTVTSTFDEALLLKEFSDHGELPVHSVIVVSDPYHMRRARWTYRKVLGKEVEVLMAPVPFDRTPYVRQWWTDQTSQRYVSDEYKKIVYYFLRYEISIGWLSKWLASFDTG